MPITNNPPTSDVGNEQWFSSVDAGTLFAEIDESSALDTDFMYAVRPDTIAEVGLGSLTDPTSSTGHVVRYRAYSDQQADLQVSLFQATTLIATWTETLTISMTLYAHTLTSGQTDSITDYTALRLRFNVLPT